MIEHFSAGAFRLFERERLGELEIYRVFFFRFGIRHSGCIGLGSFLNSGSQASIRLTS